MLRFPAPLLFAAVRAIKRNPSGFLKMFFCRTLLSAFCAFVAVLCGSAHGWLGGAERPAPVTAVVAERFDGIVREFTLTGTVTAQREARLSSRAEGLVARVAVDEGSVVQPGEVILSLDTKPAEIDLKLIQAEIETARIRVTEAKRREEEVRELSRSGGFPKSEAETLVSELRMREAELRQLEVRAEQQSELIARHHLVAPFSGVISRKIAEEGEWVATGTPVLELVEMESPRFDLQVPQEFLARITRAESLTVRLDAFPEASLAAGIVAMVPVKNPATRTFLTRLHVEDPEGRVAPGMSGTAVISYRSATEEAIRLPRDAIVRFPDGSVKVWMIESSSAGDLVRSRQIKTGGSLGEFSEVFEGLEGGERIVLKGNEGLREGQMVRVQAVETGTAAP